MEKSYVMVKPHFANYPNIIQIIKDRIVGLGLKIVDESFVGYNENTAKEHYAEHIHKGFYPELEKYIISEPAYGMIVEGEDCIAKIRSITGSTIKIDKETGAKILPAVGTIRRDIPSMLQEECRMTENVVHASDCPESAEKEIEIFTRIKTKKNNK